MDLIMMHRGIQGIHDQKYHIVSPPKVSLVIAHYYHRRYRSCAIAHLDAHSHVDDVIRIFQQRRIVRHHDDCAIRHCFRDEVHDDLFGRLVQARCRLV